MKAIMHELDYDMDDEDVAFLSQLNQAKGTAALLDVPTSIDCPVCRRTPDDRGRVRECHRYSRVLHRREDSCASETAIVRRRRHRLRHLPVARCGRWERNGVLRTMQCLRAPELLRHLGCSERYMAVQAMLDSTTARLPTVSKVRESHEKENTLVRFVRLGGPMKCTPSGTVWCHLTCALWLPELKFADYTKMVDRQRGSTLDAILLRLV